MSLTSIFDGLYVDQLIQKNERGEFVIYPNGMMGRGYVLPAEREAGVRRRLRFHMLVSLVIGISFAILVVRMTDSANAVSSLGWVVVIGIGALLFGAIFAFQRRLAVGLQPVDGPGLSLGEWLRGARRARPTWTYWFCAIVGSLMAVASVAALAVGVADRDGLVMVSGVVMLAISVLAAIDGGLGLIERRRGA